MKLKFLWKVGLVMVLLISTNAKSSEVLHGKLPYFGANWGVMNYRGDLAQIDQIGNFHNLTYGLELNMSYTLWSTIGLQLYSVTGTVSHEQRSENIVHNFRTLIAGGGLNVFFYLNNGFMLKKDSQIKPFIFGGINPISYFPYQDNFDANGNRYYYWSDGSIRDQVEYGPNERIANVIRRDNDFETSLRGENGNTILATAATGGFGFRYAVTSWLDASVKMSYTFTNTDVLDGFAAGEGNDGYYYGAFGIQVDPNILKAVIAEKDSEPEGEDVDLEDFFTLDSDGDGVSDLDDLCANTPEGAAVNAKGCAKGEVEKAGSAEVDSMAMMGDSLIVVRNTLCENYPMLCGEGEEEYLELDGRSNRKITVKKKKQTADIIDLDDVLKVADSNKDGQVELPELYDIIELFFDNKTDISLPELRKLIDHFFDQY